MGITLKKFLYTHKTRIVDKKNAAPVKEQRSLLSVILIVLRLNRSGRLYVYRQRLYGLYQNY
jgi:hypothetical protein